MIPKLNPELVSPSKKELPKDLISGQENQTVQTQLQKNYPTSSLNSESDPDMDEIIQSLKEIYDRNMDDSVYNLISRSKFRDKPLDIQKLMYGDKNVRKQNFK